MITIADALKSIKRDSYYIVTISWSHEDIPEKRYVFHKRPTKTQIEALCAYWHRVVSGAGEPHAEVTRL